MNARMYVRERVYVKVDGYACMHECVCVWPCGVGLDCPGWLRSSPQGHHDVLDERLAVADAVLLEHLVAYDWGHPCF